jgi:hypothetical protein
MRLFHLEWLIDSDGYSLSEVRRRASPYDSPSHDRRMIVRNGGHLEKRNPFEIPALCRRLAARSKSAAGALQFVQLYGFLFSADALSESTDSIIGAIEVAKILVAAADARDWVKIARWLDKAYRAGPDGTGGAGRLGVVFEVPEDASRPALHLKPANLWEAAVVQLLGEVSNGRLPRPCKRPGCPEWFNYGPGTEHRETAQYCSSKCQNAHTYMKRKETQS